MSVMPSLDEDTMAGGDARGDVNETTTTRTPSTITAGTAKFAYCTNKFVLYKQFVEIYYIKKFVKKKKTHS